LISLFEAVDQYCERTDPSLLSEPINLISNISFIIAALLLWQRKNQEQHSRMYLFFTSNIFIIGLGSGLFHSTAQVWSRLADVIPIVTYMFVFLGNFMLHGLKLKQNITLLYLLAFVVAAGLSKLLSLWIDLNGSDLYLPAWVSLWILTYQSQRIGLPSALRHFKFASTFFSISLTCRTFDFTICPSFPWGTHFLWHLFNGVVLYHTTCAYEAACKENSAVSIELRTSMQRGTS
jgi:hypothetical protein